MINTKNLFQHTPIDLCFLNGHETCMREHMRAASETNRTTAAAGAAATAISNRFKVNSILSMHQSLAFDSMASFVMSPKALMNATLGANSSFTLGNQTRPSQAIESDVRMLKQISMLRSSRKRIQNVYKIVLYLKEPLIKVCVCELKKSGFLFFCFWELRN